MGKPGTLMNTGRTEDEDLVSSRQSATPHSPEHTDTLWHSEASDRDQLDFQADGGERSWGAKTSESTTGPH